MFNEVLKKIKDQGFDKEEAAQLIANMVYDITDDALFLAYCKNCADIQTFHDGRCLQCGEIWYQTEHLLKVVEPTKPSA